MNSAEASATVGMSGALIAELALDGLVEQVKKVIDEAAAAMVAVTAATSAATTVATTSN